jgi:sugar lactone lactonase YvrE
MKKIACIFCFFTAVGFSQIITTIAGTGISSYTGDGGLAINATFSEPQYVMLDDTGNIYVVDEDNNVIRKINPAGIITTVIGTGGIGYSGDGGQALIAKIDHPGGCAIDRKGNIYIADTYNHVVRKVNTAGIISTLAGHGTIGGFGGDGGPGTAAYLNFPEMLAVDKKGNVYVTDASNNRVRKIDTSGIITTIAGIGPGTYAGDGGLATAANLNYPTGIAIDTTTGVIYIGDANNNAVRKIDTNGIITTYAGTGILGYSGDGGVSTSAKLNSPQGVTIDTAGTLYISDGGNNAIRKVNALGVISTYAGTGAAGFSGDGGPAVLAKIFNPPGITVDVTGNLYIAEYFNSRVRKVSFCSSPLNLSITGTFSVCSGDSITLTANGATTYTWSANADTALTASVIIKPTVNSTYSVAGASGGCIAIDSATVIVSTCGSGLIPNFNRRVLIYPNPASNVLNLQMNFAENVSFQIYNSTGQQLLKRIDKPTPNPFREGNIITFDVSNLSEGIYFVRILNDGQIVSTHSFIKQ